MYYWNYRKELDLKLPLKGGQFSPDFTSLGDVKVGEACEI